jgi:predicted Zn finger-like uncharacterized protein
MPEMKCPNCSQHLKVPDGAIGKRVKCSTCQHSFVAEISQAALPDQVVELPLDPEMSPRSFNMRQSAKSSSGLRQIAAVIVAGVGALTLAIGLFSLVVALGLEITEDASYSERGRLNEKRVYNNGLMHKREIEVLVSGTAILSGVMMIGFASLHPPFRRLGV